MATPIPRRSQVERRIRSEEALLDAASALIADHGVDRASLADIGARAGVSRGLPSHHFGSKDALLARLAARAQDRIEMALLGFLRRHGRSIDQMSGYDVVRFTVEGYLDLFADPPSDQRALLVMWGSTFAESASVDGMAEAERRSYDGLAGVIADGQADGSIRGDIDPVATAVLLLGTIRGVAALVLVDSGFVDMTMVRTTCMKLIQTCLATTTTECDPSTPTGCR